MAANQDESATVNTPFPNPPSYWQSFTVENLASYEELSDNISSAEVPDHLQNLRPPTPPSNGEYTIFGEKRSLTAPLKELPEDTPFLPPAAGTQPSPEHLLNLSRSLMLSYLEILHIMATNPEPPIFGVKWEDLRDLFRNTHQGLNMYRPWQARDALIKLLERTRDNARDEIRGIQGLSGKVDLALEAVAQNCEESTIGLEHQKIYEETANGDLQKEDTRIVRDMTKDFHAAEQGRKRLWDMVNEESGDEMVE